MSPRARLVAAGAGALVVIVVIVVALAGGSAPPRATGSTPSVPVPSSTGTSAPATPPRTGAKQPRTGAQTGSTTVTAPVSTPTTTPATTQIGVNVNDLFNTLQYSPAQIAGQLALVRATGVRTVRSDALWEAAEPRAPAPGAGQTFNWSFDDLVAGSLAQAGLNWLAIIDYAPTWAASYPAAPHSLPKDPSQYAAFAKAFAARYGQGGSFWTAHPSTPQDPTTTYEIWNEPDQREFAAPAPDATAYAADYIAARTAIKVSQPGATVLIGGLTNPAMFIPAMVHADPVLVGHVDGIGVHPYALHPAGVLSNVVKAREAIASTGLGPVPLYVTEFGWSTQPAGNLNYGPDSLRPGYLRDSLTAIAASTCGVEAAYVYTWVTPEAHPADEQDWFGVSHPDAPVPDADTDAIASAVAATPKPSTPCQ